MHDFMPGLGRLGRALEALREQLDPEGHNIAWDAVYEEAEKVTDDVRSWRRIASDLERSAVEVSDSDVDSWLRSLRSGYKVVFGHPQAAGLADYIERLRATAHFDERDAGA